MGGREPLSWRKVHADIIGPWSQYSTGRHRSRPTLSFYCIMLHFQVFSGRPTLFWKNSKFPPTPSSKNGSQTGLSNIWTNSWC